MTENDTSALLRFVQAAKHNGASDEFLIGLLVRRGWPADDAYTALAQYWETATGVPIPARSIVGESSRDAFLYLLSFATLATWATALGSMLFHFVDHWFPDPVAEPTFFNLRQSVTWQMASIAVAFPIYLLVMRFILFELEDSERLRSGVRKWLTYIALLITAVTMIGDLISFLNAFLLGEISVRFVLKSAAIMFICAGIFAWYLRFLRWSQNDCNASRKERRIPVFAAVAILSVVSSFAGGFALTGTPGDQRQFAADNKRLEDLRRIAAAMYAWHTRFRINPASPQALPSALRDLQTRDFLVGAIFDPVTRSEYEYHPHAANSYELCASFAHPTAEGEQAHSGYRSNFWQHAAGRSCFMLDASQPSPW